MQKIKLIKMNGLGNDFLIYDARVENYNFSRDEIIKLSARSNSETKGCDQFIILKKPLSNEDGFIEIFNADGSEVSACGNATRCIGLILANSLAKPEVKIRTKADLLIASKISDTEISVNMGRPQFAWDKIPLAKNISNLNLPIILENFGVSPSAVSIGNPHMVFFLSEDVSNLNIAKLGSPLETHPLFPEKANVSFANIVDNTNIKLRVFERGVGETLACGTAACATAVLAYAQKLCASENINIHMQGGVLKINYSGENIIMTGGVEMEATINYQL
jgi:diaminopimelate epimerase